jgi:hypothetical protein
MVLILIVLIKQEKISELQYSIMYIARDYICSWQLNSSGSKFQLQFLVSQLKPAGTSGSVENTVYVLTDKQTDRQLERHGQTDKTLPQIPSNERLQYRQPKYSSELRGSECESKVFLGNF